jgi:hypothetical protein
VSHLLYSSLFFLRGALFRAGAFFSAAVDLFFAVLVLRAVDVFFSGVAVSFFVVVDEREEREPPIVCISMRVRCARNPRRRL